MTKSALTFAEIFVVLALIFLIQAVANFNLFSGIGEAATKPNIELLKIRQVPSSGSDADHLSYLRISNAGSTMHLALTDRAVYELISTRSRRNIEGLCEAVAPVDKATIRQWSDATLELVERNFKIKLLKVGVSGAQDEYVLIWEPANIKQKTKLTIGFRRCNIGINARSVKIDKAWKLPHAALSSPHPVIIDRLMFTDRIEADRARVHYFHRSHRGRNIPLSNSEWLTSRKSRCGNSRIKEVVVRLSRSGNW